MKSYNMGNLGIGLIVAGGFLFGVGAGHIVPIAGIVSVIGIAMIAVGLLVLFAIGGRQKKRRSRN